MSIPMTALRPTVAAVLLLVAGAAIAMAASFEDLVGRWAIEVRENETFNGEPYNIRRQIEHNRPDGTKSVTFRFYDDCRLVGELINHSRWGVRNGVHWVRCTSIEQGGQSVPCDRYHEYPITSVGPDKVTYFSRDRGTAYELVRVDDGYQLPASSCVTQAPRPPVRLARIGW